ncbi:hypothetical protein EHP00_1540 [Ecytonucleospora hepatopenaei]|uniref:Uncharacterized protein n=1 Tax=Ecytonucleospora hepatopenaei TaxID=646526 RepID=A0A1W0E385_9MICR|nr:hypothetical protein EHP00_1540 [Ecytonucleospora hepatopenaei]
MFILLIFLLNNVVKGATALNNCLNNDYYSSEDDRWGYDSKSESEIESENENENENENEGKNESYISTIKSHEFCYLQTQFDKIVMPKNQKLFLPQKTRFGVCTDFIKVNDTCLKSIEDVLAEDETICDAAYIKIHDSEENKAHTLLVTKSFDFCYLYFLENNSRKYDVETHDFIQDKALNNYFCPFFRYTFGKEGYGSGKWYPSYFLFKRIDPMQVEDEKITNYKIDKIKLIFRNTNIDMNAKQKYKEKSEKANKDDKMRLCIKKYCDKRDYVKEVEVEDKKERAKVYNEMEKYICFPVDFQEESELLKFLRGPETTKRFVKMAYYKKNLFQKEDKKPCQYDYDEDDKDEEIDDENELITLNDFILKEIHAED